MPNDPEPDGVPRAAAADFESAVNIPLLQQPAVVNTSINPQGTSCGASAQPHNALWLAVVAAPTANAEAEGVKVCVHCLL